MKECPPGKVLNPKTNRCIKEKTIKRRIKVPKPTREDTEFSGKQIDEMLTFIIKKGKEPITDTYSGIETFYNTFFLYLFKKYRSNCYVIGRNMTKEDDEEDDLPPMNIEINLRATSTTQDHEHFTNLIKNCIIKQRTPIIIIPLSVIDEYGRGHFNVLIYRRDLNHIEHFEPYGPFFGGNESKHKEIEKDINKYITHLNKHIPTPVKFISSSQICPFDAGVQYMDEFLRKNRGTLIDPREPSEGYCTIWSLFFTELVLKNPERTSYDLIYDIMTKVSGDELINLARGYTKIVCNKLQQIYSVLYDKSVTTDEIIDSIESYDIMDVILEIVANEHRYLANNDELNDSKYKVFVDKLISKYSTKKNRNDKMLFNYYKNMESFIDEEKKSEIKVCPPGKVLNSKTNRCNKVKIVKAKTEKVKKEKSEEPKKNKECPPDKMLNLLTNRCIKIKESKKSIKIPEPARVDSDFSPNQIDKMLANLIEHGKQPIKQKYRGYGFFQDIYLMYLMKKYKTTCYTMSITNFGDLETPVAVRVDEENPPTSNEMGNFVDRIFNCIVKKSIPIIVIPLLIIDPSYTDAHHYNVLIYRRDKHQIEHFEPHGKYYSSDYAKFEIIRDHINYYIDELNSQLTNTTDMLPVDFITSEQVCPMLKGLQSNEELGRIMLKLRNRKSGKSVKHDYEPGGFCTIWGLFFIELVLKNPDMASSDLLRMVMDKINATQLIDVARGYMNVVCNKLQQYYTTLLGKPVSTTEIVDIMLNDKYNPIYTALYTILLFERALESNNAVVTSEIYAKEAQKQVEFLESDDADAMEHEVRLMLRNYFKYYATLVTPSPTREKKKECPPGKELNPKTNRCKTIKTKRCPPGKVLNPKTRRCNKIK
jgi:hypothetical protein